MAGGVSPSLRVGSEEGLCPTTAIFNVQVKCSVLCISIAKKTTCGQKPGPRGLINPLGLKM